MRALEYDRAGGERTGLVYASSCYEKDKVGFRFGIFGISPRQDCIRI